MIQVNLNSTVGMETFVVTATNPDNKSCTMNIDLYVVRVIGFQIEERAWGEGTGDEGWHGVEDVPATGPKDWALLWGENEYRWTPILENGVGNKFVVGTEWYAVPWSSRANPVLGSPFAGSLIEADMSNYVSNVIPAGARATGTPGVNGTNEIAIIPKVKFDHDYDSGGGGSTHCTTTGIATMSWRTTPSDPTPKPASQQMPRVGVTKIASVEWGYTFNSTVATNEQNVEMYLAQLKPPQTATKEYYYDELWSVYPTFSPRPNEQALNQARVIVNLASDIPADMTGTVHLAWFDCKFRLKTGGEEFR